MDQYVGLGTAFFLRPLGPLLRGEPRAWHVRVADQGAIRHRKGEHHLLFWTRQTWQWHPWRDEYLGQFGGYSIDLPQVEETAPNRPVEEAPTNDGPPPPEATAPQTGPTPQHQEPLQPPSSRRHHLEFTHQHSGAQETKARDRGPAMMQPPPLTLAQGGKLSTNNHSNNHQTAATTST